MSAEFYGYALIGIEIDSSMIYSTIYVSNCSCQFEMTDTYRFCPVCGTPFSERNIPVPDFNDEEKLFHGFKVVCTSDKKRFFLGYGTRCDIHYDQAQMLPITDILDLKKRLRDLFTFLGKSWDEQKFGLWSISRYIP